jgi:hypothetical protein
MITMYQESYGALLILIIKELVYGFGLQISKHTNKNTNQDPECHTRGQIHNQKGCRGEAAMRGLVALCLDYERCVLL